MLVQGLLQGRRRIQRTLFSGEVGLLAGARAEGADVATDALEVAARVLAERCFACLWRDLVRASFARFGNCWFLVRCSSIQERF